jgi:hypothetical protein
MLPRTEFRTRPQRLGGVCIVGLSSCRNAGVVSAACEPLNASQEPAPNLHRVSKLFSNPSRDYTSSGGNRREMAFKNAMSGRPGARGLKHDRRGLSSVTVSTPIFLGGGANDGCSVIVCRRVPMPCRARHPMEVRKELDKARNEKISGVALLGVQPVSLVGRGGQLSATIS